MLKEKRTRFKKSYSLLFEAGRQCANCKKLLKNRVFHVDHIIPLKEGGDNYHHNLRVLCVKCHKKKHGRVGNVYTSKCVYCGLVIESFEKCQSEHLLLQHKISKHRDKIKITEKKR